MITNISILGLVVLNILILYISRKYIGPEFAANLLSIFNYAIPYIICRTISFDVPSHEDHYQLFLFYKLIVFRWINTVFVVFMITPFTSTLTESDAALLPTIGKLFYNEIWLTPLLCYCDPWGNFVRLMIYYFISYYMKLNMSALFGMLFSTNTFGLRAAGHKRV